MTMLAASRLTSHSQGAGQRLVEVVGVEHERPLGRREEPEVGQVGVTAGLHDDVGPGRGREVEGHHRGRAAVVGEGRLGHARVAQRDEVGQAVRLLLLEDGDGVAARPRLEGGVAGARHALASGPPLVEPDRWVDPRPRRPGVPSRRLGGPGLGVGRCWCLLRCHLRNPPEAMDSSCVRPRRAVGGRGAGIPTVGDAATRRALVRLPSVARIWRASRAPCHPSRSRGRSSGTSGRGR